MGLFDIFKKGKKQGQNPTQNSDTIKIAIQQTCSNLTQFCRDANLPYELTNKYQKGMIIRERGFVDATVLSGGIVTNHRYIILSNHMTPIFQFWEDKQWALCVANKDSRFLVLGKAECKGKRVTVLLHLNNETWQLFKSINMNIFQNLLNDCYNSFKDCLGKEPIASVSTEEWFARCKFPVGMSDSGDFFPIDD